MPTYMISSDGKRVAVESDTWLYAIASALPEFGLDPATLDQLICSMNPDGSVDVLDVVSQVRIRIGTDGAGPALSLDMPRAAMAINAAGDHADLLPPPRSWGWDVGVPTDRLALALERSAQILAAPDVEQACRAALQIVSDLVAAESGAVLLRKGGTESLSFVAAVGPSAHRVLGTDVPMALGIAGFSYTCGIGVVVQDVDKDGRFASAVDHGSGYHTRSLLAAPVRVVDGPIFGCLELLNALEGFVPEDLEIIRVVAAALGGRLRS